MVLAAVATYPEHIPKQQYRFLWSDARDRRDGRNTDGSQVLIRVATVTTVTEPLQCLADMGIDEGRLDGASWGLEAAAGTRSRAAGVRNLQGLMRGRLASDAFTGGHVVFTD